MSKQTSDMKVETENFRCLVIGEGGTGKSTFAGTFPTPAYLFDFDKGAIGYRDVEGITCDQFEPKVIKTSENTGWNDVLTKLMAIKQDPEYKTIIVDSMTTLIDLAMTETMYNNKARTATGGATWDHYGAVRNLVQDFIRVLYTFPTNLVIIAHVISKEDGPGGRIIKQPMLTGQLSVLVPLFFNEVYYSQILRKGDKSEYVLQTVNRGYYNGKSAISGKEHLLPDFVPNDYNVLMDLVRGKK